MSFTIGDVVAEAGVGNPWEVATQVPADAGPVVALQRAFTSSGEHAGTATAAAGTADSLTAQNFRNNGHAVHEAAPATTATRTALADGGELLVSVGGMLGRVAAQLTESRSGITTAIAALDAEIAAVMAESNRLAGLTFPSRAATDQAEHALRQRAVAAVRTHGGTVARLVDAYDSVLRSGLGVLADQGFAAPDPAQDPTAAPPPPPARASPEEVNAWWTGLSWQQQAELLRSSPELLGNLDGLPAEVRDTANRARIPTEIDRVDSAIAEAERRLTEFRDAPALLADPRGRAVIEAHLAGELDTLRDQREALAAIERTLALPDRHLLTLDTSGEQVLAAVANGDVDRAAHVAVLTAGFGTIVQPGPDEGLAASIHVSLESYDEGLAALRDRAQQQMLLTGQTGDVATVAWLGYEAPQPTTDVLIPGRSVLGDSAAYRGADQLAGFLNGINASRPQDPHLTAIGHSYGSLTTAVAVRQPTGVDEVVLLGSPGAGTSDVNDLQVPQGHVHVGESDGDVIADAAWFGTDPNQLDGVNNLSTQEATAPNGEQLRASEGHYPVSGPTAYLAPGTTSQYNVAQVVLGRSDQTIQNRNWDTLDYLNAPFSWLSGN